MNSFGMLSYHHTVMARATAVVSRAGRMNCRVHGLADCFTVGHAQSGPRAADT